MAGGKIKARKYLTCAACRKYVLFQGDLTACGKCAQRYDLDADVSVWKGSTWVKGGGEPASTAKGGANMYTKAPPKGAGKGSKAMTDGTLAKGYSWLYDYDVANFSLTEHDKATVGYFETLSKEQMEAMAALPQYSLWQRPFQLIAQRKFPLVDDETDLDRQLEAAKRKVTRLEKLRDSARDETETAKAALNDAMSKEKKQETEWREALDARDALSLKHAAAVELRRGAQPKKPVVPQPATVVVEKPLAVVMEGKLAHYKRDLAALKETRRTAAASLTTWSSKITSLREAIPAEDDDDDEAKEKRERSPIRIGNVKTQLAEAEKKHAEITGQIDKCDETAAGLTATIEKFTQLAGDMNSLVANPTGSVDGAAASSS